MDVPEDGSNYANPAQSTPADDKSTAPEPVRPMKKKDEVTAENAEMDEIDELIERVEKMERSMNVAEEETEIPVIKEHEKPSAEEVARHEVAHAHYKSWCKYCNQGLAIRD